MGSAKIFLNTKSKKKKKLKQQSTTTTKKILNYKTQDRSMQLKNAFSAAAGILCFLFLLKKKVLLSLCRRCFVERV